MCSVQGLWFEHEVFFGIVTACARPRVFYIGSTRWRIGVVMHRVEDGWMSLLVSVKKAKKSRAVPVSSFYKRYQHKKNPRQSENQVAAEDEAARDRLVTKGLLRMNKIVTERNVERIVYEIIGAPS